MALKDILVPLDADRGHEARIALAVALARRTGAHLTGLFVIEPMSLATAAGPGGADIAALEVFQQVQEGNRLRRREVGEGLARAFRAAAKAAGVDHDWRIAEDAAAASATRHARYADLVIVGQADPDQPAIPDIAQSLLLGSGRPVLMIPYIGAASVGRRALIAWNASREAARATHDALPLLTAAENVTVLSIDPISGDGAAAPSAADLVRHLARHGIKAEAAQGTADDVSVGDLILSRAADLTADLIVMGGYGHSRAREFVMGGATRTLLRHMTVPVLMAH
jgi:nucleotide-binding universal stress UspA family protein